MVFLKKLFEVWSGIAFFLRFFLLHSAATVYRAGLPGCCPLLPASPPGVFKAPAGVLGFIKLRCRKLCREGKSIRVSLCPRFVGLC